MTTTNRLQRTRSRVGDLRLVPRCQLLCDLTAPANVYLPDTVGRVSQWLDRSTNSNTMALVLNGVAGNYASTPDAAALDITGDIDIRVRLTANDWTPATDAKILSKRGAVTTAYEIFFDGTVTPGRLAFYNGVTVYYSTAATGFVDGTTHWVRVTRAAAATSLIFYTSEDGITWTQLGTTVTILNVALTATADDVGIGANSVGGPFSGLVHYAQILSGINGTPALTVDFSLAARGASSFVCTTGQTITITTTGATGARISGARDLYQGGLTAQGIALMRNGLNYGWLPGVAGNYFSTLDSVVLSVPGDIGVRAFLSMDDWTPAADQCVISKWSNGAGNASWRLSIQATTGKLYFGSSIDGTATSFPVSSVAPTVADGAILGIMVTRVAASGVVTFYTSTDWGITWTQLGTTGASTAGALFDTAIACNVGAFAGGGSDMLAGKIYYADIRNNILNDGTGIVAKFDPKEAADGAATWNSSTGEVWSTNTSGEKPATIVGRSSVLLDGADDFFKTPPWALVQPETVYFVGRMLTWTVNDRVYDGNATLTMLLTESGTTPTVAPYAGSSGATTTQWAVGAMAVITVVFNGAASITRVSKLAGASGNVGASNGGGFTLGAAGDTSGWGNLQICAMAVFSGAHDNATQLRVIDALMRQNRL